ncbi:ubiquitin-conjugating enzyme/RWD-like protein [Gorgonomyces haynaldii]|nr:ubiquitin-conjugating enzyme/RWD-like protein [Gorgonomyces haynaldii]
MQSRLRMTKELKQFKNPPPGITVWPEGESLFDLQATIVGLDDCPYEKGQFQLELKIGDRYPFEPPLVRFKTKIYHPNVDEGGRICLDVLKTPPKGTWNPSLSVLAVLKSIQLLMMEPNPDDPLDMDIAQVYKSDYSLFCAKAKEWTLQYANQSSHVSSEQLLQSSNLSETKENVDTAAVAKAVIEQSPEQNSQQSKEPTLRDTASARDSSSVGDTASVRDTTDEKSPLGSQEPKDPQKRPFEEQTQRRSLKRSLHSKRNLN